MDRNNALELNALIDENGLRKPFSLTISSPATTDGHGDYVCWIRAPALFANDKAIYGVDAEQALALARQFVKSLLGARSVVDGNGETVNW